MVVAGFGDCAVGADGLAGHGDAAAGWFDDAGVPPVKQTPAALAPVDLLPTAYGFQPAGRTSASSWLAVTGAPIVLAVMFSWSIRMGI